MFHTFVSRPLLLKNYSRGNKIFVEGITRVTLGRELIRRCGNEGQHRYLDAAGYTTLRFLRAAIAFVPVALNDGADMSNAAFIFSQPGGDFYIQAGSADWQYYFAEDQNGKIYTRNIRRSFARYWWESAKSVGKGLVVPPSLDWSLLVMT